MTDKRDPWTHAIAAQRGYITPEDITEAIDFGADRLSVATVVLEAIGARQAEDATLCAWVAGKYARTGDYE